MRGPIRHLTRTLLFVVCCSTAPLCGGCGSAVARISQSAQQVGTDATTIRTSAAELLDLSARAHSDFQDIHVALTNPSSGVVVDPAVLARKAKDGMTAMERITLLTRGIDSSASAIGSTAADIINEVPAVQDRDPWWLGALKLWGWVVLLLIIAGGGLYLGVWPFLARILALAFGWVHLLPRPAVAAAKLDAEAQALPTVDGKQKEATVAKRLGDKNYDVAYRVLSKNPKADKSAPIQPPGPPVP